MRIFKIKGVEEEGGKESDEIFLEKLEEKEERKEKEKNYNTPLQATSIFAIILLPICCVVSSLEFPPKTVTSSF